MAQTDTAQVATEGAYDTADQVIDGRVARRQRNRGAVIDAVLELFSENNLQPGPDEVARRCGLSAKSVGRYFQDGDALLNAAIERQLELVFPLFHLHAIGRGALEQRVEGFVSARLKAHEMISATARAANLLAMSNPTVRTNFDRARDLMREQIEVQFATELDAAPIDQRRSNVAAIDALFQFETLDHYRVRRRFSQRQTQTMLVTTLNGLLDSR